MHGGGYVRHPRPPEGATRAAPVQGRRRLTPPPPCRRARARWRSPAAAVVLFGADGLVAPAASAPLRVQTVGEKDFLDAVNKVIKGYAKFSATPKYMVYN